MSADPISLAAFALLSLTALVAAGVVACSASAARQGAALAGLGAAVAAVMAGLLDCGFTAAGVLVAEVAMAGLVVTTAARWEWAGRGGSPPARLSVGVSVLAVGVGTAALLAALGSLEVFLVVPAATGGAPGRDLAGALLLPFLLVSFLLLTGVGGLVLARRRGGRAAAGVVASGGGAES